VEVLDADPDAGIVILERLFPGENIHALSLENDDEATRIAAGVMMKLWKPISAAPSNPAAQAGIAGESDHSFPTVARWSRGLQRLRDANGGGTGPLPSYLVERAEATYRELLASAPPPVLLHGDLHHDNILTATRSPYLAIDPKGVVGEPAYEVGPLFYNPQPELYRLPDLAKVLGRRLAILSESLQIDRQRLFACAFAHSVLSAAWSVEDDEYDDGYLHTLRVSGALLQL
jgi:streptomycin 6-kinase